MPKCTSFFFFTDLHKIGGFDLFPTLLQDNEEDVRANTCSLIATVVQNNPCCQTEALKLGLLSQLLNLLDKDDRNQVKVKALYAISCKYNATKNVFRFTLKVQVLIFIIFVLIKWFDHL